MNILRKSYELCEDWVTRQRNKYASDPFFAARVKMTLMYLFVGIIISFVVSEVADNALREAVYEIASFGPGGNFEELFRQAQQDLWFWRMVRLLLLVISASLLAQYSLRPVKKSSELQKRFANIASHELRTPIAVMKNQLEVILRHKDKLSVERAVSALQSNLEEVEKLAGISEFLLLFSDLNNGGKRELEQVSLLEALTLVKTDMEKLYECNVILPTAQNTPSILADKMGLYILFRNIIKNAITYGGDTKKVSVDIAESDSEIVISIADNGPGILDEDLPYVFEPFYRGGQPHERANGGMGIGLSIARQIVTMYGATIGIESKKDMGTVCTMTFRK